MMYPLMLSKLFFFFRFHHRSFQDPQMCTGVVSAWSRRIGNVLQRSVKRIVR